MTSSSYTLIRFFLYPNKKIHSSITFIWKLDGTSIRLSFEKNWQPDEQVIRLLFLFKWQPDSLFIRLLIFFKWQPDGGIIQFSFPNQNDNRMGQPDEQSIRFSYKGNCGMNFFIRVQEESY